MDMANLNPAFFWLVLGLALLIMEVVTPGFVILFFGLAAIVVGLLCLVFPLGGGWQLLLFAAISVISLVTLRKQLRQVMTGRKSDDDQGIDDSCVGQRVVVVEGISPSREGKVEMHGVSWSAQADEVLEPGTRVTVMDRKGLTLTVKRQK